MHLRTLFAALTLATTACGGGGGGSRPGSDTATDVVSTPPPATTTSVNSSGVITGFSSVYVNGTKYEVQSDTVVEVEDETEIAGDDSALKIGMRVKVRASEQGGIRTAQKIQYDDDLKGPVSEIAPDGLNPSLGTVNVLQQTVIVDGNTIMDSSIGDNNGDGTIDILDLQLDGSTMVIEVSGLVVDSGFLATRIERSRGASGDPDVTGDEYEIKGFIDSVAMDRSSFVINNATILITAGDTLFEDGLAADQSLVGEFVEVDLDQDATGNLIAVNVKREDDFLDSDGDGDIDIDDRSGRFEIKGILRAIDSATSPASVTIGATTISVNDTSSLAGREGMLIELKGEINDTGVLIINEVELEFKNEVRLEDLVAEIDTSSASLTTRLGIDVSPTGASRVEDDLDDQGDHLTPAEFLSRVQPGHRIDARGFLAANGEVSWTRIENEIEADNDCRLRGPITSIEGSAASDFTFTIQGVTVDVSTITENQNFRGANDAGIGREAFFELLQPGSVVQATSDAAGTGCENGRLTARQVEFEVDDDLTGSVSDANENPTTSDGRVVSAGTLTGTVSNITANSFVIAGETVVVSGGTIIDDSLIEAALGAEFDGNDQRFDQLPTGITLFDLLSNSGQINVQVSGDNLALKIEDL